MNFKAEGNIQLEDASDDIIEKAMRGCGIGKKEMSERTGICQMNINKILAGELLENEIRLIAEELNLDTEKLLISARKEWLPKPMELVGVKKFVSDFGSMTVNSYVIFEQNSKKAWIFDTGTECDSLISFIEEEGLKVDSILLTHTHRDHILCLTELKNYYREADVFVHKSELIEDAIPIDEGFQLAMGVFELNSLHTHGHSRGGMTYIIKGLPCPVAIVGDAIFAGSMGGGLISYQDALRTNLDKTMTLPDETILCPGHCPTTTVKEEKEHNPFFPEF